MTIGKKGCKNEELWEKGTTGKDCGKEGFEKRGTVGSRVCRKGDYRKEELWKRTTAKKACGKEGL
jgi:hypothetical protein